MKQHRHLTAFEWHGSPSMVPSNDQDRAEPFTQQGQVLDVLEISGDRVTVPSIDRNDPQQRHETAANDTRLHDVRVDVDRFHSLVPCLRVVSFRSVIEPSLDRATRQNTFSVVFTEEERRVGLSDVVATVWALCIHHPAFPLARQTYVSK